MGMVYFLALTRRHGSQHNDTQHYDTQHKGFICDITMICHCTEFHYAECHCAECRGAIIIEAFYASTFLYNPKFGKLKVS